MQPFTIHTKDSAPEGSREALGALEANIGFIPNLAATIAASPVAFQGFVGMQSALRGSKLTGVEREVVGLTVSHENDCPYSMAAHSTFASAQGADAPVVEALRSGDELPDERLEALHAFTRELLRSRGHVSGDDCDRLLAAGYSPEQLLEVIAQVAYTTLANLAANVADTPVDDAFGAQAWAVAR